MAITLDSFQKTVERIIGQRPRDVFHTILLEGLEQEIVPVKTKRAREYYRGFGYMSGQTSKKTIFTNEKRMTSTPIIGKMYLFRYFPKMFKTLPYHDRLPMIFPIDVINNGIMGINLHYLPLLARASLMDALYTLSSDKNYDEKTKLRISYDVLKAASRFGMFKPCVKKYLFNHLQSPFFEVNSLEWDIALFLPVEMFARGAASPNPGLAATAQQESLNKV
jgi:hypothetical protein